MGARSLHRTGFSLMETLIAVAVLGVVFSVAFVPTLRYFRTITVQGAASRFIGAQSLARSVATRYPSGAELHVDATADAYWVLADADGTAGLDTIGSVRRTDPVDLASTAAVLCYDVRGLPWTGAALGGGTCDGPAATVVMTVASVSDTLVINALGKAQR